MIVKEIEFTKDKLLAGINKIEQAVGSTMGPMGRTVLIESENHTRGVTVTKDGVTVAKSLVVDDPVENLAITLVKEASEKTAISAGDGTTTSVILTHAIIDGMISRGELTTGANIRRITNMFDGVVAALEDMAVPVNEQDLFKVATISANGDESIGKIVADAYASVGKDGIVTVENSNSSRTYCEVVNGMRITRGWSSKYMVTDAKKQEIVLENPYILMTDQEIPNITSIEHILAACIAQNRAILIIGEVSEAAMNALNLNKMKGVIKVGVVLPPQFGWKRQEMLQDIAIATGGKHFSDATGDNLSLVTMQDLGTCQKAIISKDSTVLLLEDGQAPSEHIQQIREIVTNSEEEAAFKAERIANLSGGIAVIYVGGQSDIEQKEKKDRVDDAVCATQAAIQEGILPGGGYALLAAVKDNPFLSDMVKDACSAPFFKILENAGYEHEDIVEIRDNFLQTGLGFNPVDESYGDIVGMGIIDPLKVTKNALKNAVSVATTIMSTECIIFNVRA